GVLEQRTYRRFVPSRAWSGSFARLRGECGAPVGERLEQLVVLRAVHGDRIDQAVLDFFRGSTEGATVEWTTPEGEARVARAHVVGYAGHNRLMDGLELPAADASRPQRSGLPASFVLACHSENYFSESLRALGSAPLVM